MCFLKNRIAHKIWSLQPALWLFGTFPMLQIYCYFILRRKKATSCYNISIYLTLSVLWAWIKNLVKSCLHLFGYSYSFSALPSRKLQARFCALPCSEFDGVRNVYVGTLMMTPLHCNSIHTPPSSPKSKSPRLSPTAMKRHFGRFSATSKNRHWASVKWTKSVYLSSEILFFPLINFL